MCGIFAFIGTQKDAPQQTIKGLKKLEYRGYDSWGVAYLKQNCLIGTKRIGKIGTVTLPKMKSNLAIGHTRWATHGGISQKNAHPHLNPEKTIAVVHNGIVENFETLKKQLCNYHFLSTTDTEVITALLAQEMLTLSLVESIFSVSKQLKGLNAFVVAYAPTKQILATRNGSPLVVGMGNKGYYLASDTTALAGVADKVMFLEDEQVISLSQDSITLFSNKGIPAHIKWQRFEMSAQSVDKKGYDFYMLKEINEQPAILQKVLTSLPSIDALRKVITGKKIILVGCGTAYHACLSATYYFAYSGIWAQAFSGSEFRHWRSLIDKKYHVIFVSQSGETIDLTEQAEWLLKHNHSFSAIVNRPESTLSRLANTTVYLQAGPEICVLATKSFTTKLAHFLLLAANTSFNDKKQLISKAAKASATVIKNSYCSKYIVPLVRMIKKRRNLFVIGKNDGYPIALEAALKIKESSYIHAEGFAAGELKHGVLALIKKGTPVFVVLSNSDDENSIYSSAQEVKARGGYLIGVGEKTQDHHLFDWYIPIDSSGLSTGITQSVVFQLVAYHIAIQLKKDPDKPRNLAKSVTVK